MVTLDSVEARGSVATDRPNGPLAPLQDVLRQRLEGARDAFATVAGAVRRNRPWQSEVPAPRPTIPRGRVYTSPLRNGSFAAIIPGDTVVEAVLTQGIAQTLSLYNAALIGRLILTWFPNPPMVILGPLATICDPYLNLFRGLIPPLGGTIDLSPILAFVVLDLFTNSAAALPCEIGPDGQPVTEVQGMWTPAKGARAWQARMRATRLRKAEERKARQASDVREN
mmetsp:Transcript_12228/g.34386  ORF Transcript_12228/g.34386 Transcript_12228/m.34386 type:complete len:225 (+) Transcript_12228:111-785(+)